VFRRLAKSWIKGNQSFKGDGWHPFTISVRLVNWLIALSAFERKLVEDRNFYNYFLSSFFGQVQILSKDLEFDVRGNHILKNIRALLFVSLSFDSLRLQHLNQWALRLLEQELNEQVLLDGGHFERSPGYHLEVLKDCLEIAILHKRTKGYSSEWLDDALRRMLSYLIEILPLDGRMPLLKDTVWFNDQKPEDLLAASALYFDEPAYKHSHFFGLYPILLFGISGWKTFKKWPKNRIHRGSVALRETGYYVMRNDQNGDYLIFDGGKPCPDYLPAHAHADMFSYELTVRGQRVVVDSGVYEYTSGPWRNFFRSTRAHNTAEIEGENQSEVWDSFRVARRAHPKQVIWNETKDYIVVQGTHDGYQRLKVPVIHRRTVVWQKDAFWLIVDDFIGRGCVTSSNYIHLNPLLSIQSEGKSIWRIEGHELPLWITGFGHEQHSICKGQNEPISQGWYSENFGQLQANTVLILEKKTPLPFFYGYIISKQEPANINEVYNSEQDYEIMVSYRQKKSKLYITEDKVFYVL
jgi:hypothetical protein